MKLAGYYDAYYTFTGKLSDVTRNAAYAAIALIWIFSPSQGGTSPADTVKKIDPQLVDCLLLVVATLILDALQYIAGSIIWRVVYRQFEKEGKTEDEELRHDERLPLVVEAFLIAKVVTCGIAYIILFVALWKRTIV